MGLNFLQGKKTYIIVVATLCYAIGGVIAGYISLNECIALILGALGLAGLRAGVADSVQPPTIPQ